MRANEIGKVRALHRHVRSTLALAFCAAVVTEAAAQETFFSWPHHQGRASGDLMVESAAQLSVFAPYATTALAVPLIADASVASQDILSQWPQGTTLGKTLAPTILISLGLFAFKDEGFLSRQNVREFRNTYFPDFESEFDNFSRDFPTYLTFGLNIAGVQGRSKFLRAALNYFVAFQFANISFTLGKQLAEVRRPDGSSTTSFPSAHTSTAFVGATFLHKEYGEKSNLYSITGYGMAILTGVMRQLNDKHWISDVLVGAGVGILSTEMAYVLVDHFAKDWKLNPPPQVRAVDRPVTGKPSFVNFRAGYAINVGDLSERDDVLFAEDGWTAGLEGAWFLNRYFGVGGELTVAAFPLNADNFIPPEDDILLLTDDINTEPVASQSVFVGPYFSVPISDKWSATAKATAGWASGGEGQISLELRDEFQEEFGRPSIPVFNFEGGESFGFAGSVGLRGLVSRNIGLSVFAEYNYSSPDYQVQEATDIDDEGNVSFGPVETIESVKFDYLAFGASVYALIW